jgi:hypothetical protein
MTDQEITKIKIGKFEISIIGIKETIAELAPTHADKRDEEIAAVMLERLRPNNYIPGGAKEEYAQAFVREFRKFAGQPTRTMPLKEWKSKSWGWAVRSATV